MKMIKVEKLGKWWYVRVFEDETLLTQASFATRKAAREVRDHWLAEKFFGDAVEG